MTLFYVFDVGHGSCMGLVSKAIDIFLIDAGSGGEKRFSPGNFLSYFGKSSPDFFAIQNFDQDHISGILEFEKPGVLHRNKTTDSQELRALKKQQDPTGPTPQLEHALRLHNDYNQPVAQGSHVDDKFLGLNFEFYTNSWNDFRETNNTSLCIFFELMGTKFFLPGDIEKKGLDRLVTENERVRQNLLRTDVLIAPHHGRSTGYSPEAFKDCHFKCVVVSDGRVKHATQRAQPFRNHVPRGLKFPGGKRRVLSTRKDGTICFFPTKDNKLAVQLDNGNQAYIS